MLDLGRSNKPHWLKSLSAAHNKAALSVMREIRKDSDRLLSLANQLRCRFGEKPATPIADVRFAEGEALSLFLVSIGRGDNPRIAAASAASHGTEIIELANRAWAKDHDAKRGTSVVGVLAPWLVHIERATK